MRNLNRVAGTLFAAVALATAVAPAAGAATTTPAARTSAVSAQAPTAAGDATASSRCRGYRHHHCYSYYNSDNSGGYSHHYRH